MRFPKIPYGAIESILGGFLVEMGDPKIGRHHRSPVVSQDLMTWAMKI